MNQQLTDFNQAVKKLNVSWVVIVIAWLIFWPVGLFLLWTKVSSDKQAPLRNSKSLFVLGIIIAAAGTLNLLSSIGSYRFGSRLAWNIFLIIGGVALVRMSNKMKAKGEKYKGYIGLVANQGLTSVDSLAAAMSLEPSTVIADLQDMIRMGYFGQATLDLGAREIVFPARQPAYQTAQPQQQAATQRVVTCGSCGANNTLYGAVGECEFCGSPLS